MRESMRVAQLLYSGLGGHGSVAFSLLDADKNQEWQSLMGFLGIESLLPAYAESCQKRGIDYQYFPAVSGKPWRVWPRISRWLNCCRPEAIVLHSITALLPCFWYTRRLDITLVVVEHQCNALKRPVEWVFSYLAMLLADRVIVLTPMYQDELKETLGVFYRADKVHLIPNGIDTTRFTPSDNPVIPNRTVRLGMAARFTTMKRQDVLVGMLLELRRCMPEIDWQLSLAGGGEGWEGIRQMIQAQGLEKCISLPGQLDEPELIKWYQIQDIYLHASMGETLSTSLLQAMATRIPIVASDVPGIRNLLGSQSICGVLVAAHSPVGFANEVIKLRKNSSYAEEIAKTGRQLAIAAYSQNEMFSGYMKLLKK